MPAGAWITGYAGIPAQNARRTKACNIRKLYILKNRTTRNPIYSIEVIFPTYAHC